MKVRFLKDAAGVKAGFENDIPENVAQVLLAKGVVEEVKASKKVESKKEEAPEMETKEEKTVSKRRTKSKK